MLETSKDLLNILLGVSVLMVAILMSWVFYQVGRMIRNTNRVIESAQNFVRSLHDGFDRLKEKSTTAAAYAGLILKGAEQFFSMVQKKQASRKKQK